jgi:hypothetical protein
MLFSSPSSGGPNWEREFFHWQREQADDWTLISQSERRVKIGLDAMRNVQPTSIVSKKKLKGKKLKFADTICYDACKGNNDSNLASRNKDKLPATERNF